MIEIEMMPTVDLADAAQVLTRYAKDPNQQPVILTHKGKPVAVVFPAEGGDVESISVSLNPQFNAMIERSRHRCETEGTISHEEICRRFGLPPPKPLPEPKPRPSRTRKKARKNDGQV